MPEAASTGALRRVLGPWSAASIVVGTIIGSGIFLVPKPMIAAVGAVPLVFLVWIVGGLLSLCGALCYAELSSSMPEAGGEYVYLREAYGPLAGFLCGWTQTWVTKSGSIASMATGLFYYLANFVPALEKSFIVVPLPIGPDGGPLEIRYGQFSAVAVILFLAVLNYWGTRLGGGVQVITTAAKVGLLGAIIAFGLFSGQGRLENLTSHVPVQAGLAGFFTALVAALWAYDGWNNLGMAASEVKHPQRNLPLALLTGTLIVIAVYLAANLAYFLVLPADAVAASDRVAAEMMRRITGPAGGDLVSVAAIISIFAALNGAILTGARIPYAMAHDGKFFRALGRVSPLHGTPGPAILLICLWSALLVFSGRFEQLFTYVIFANWLIFTLGAGAVIVLRRRRPEMMRPYRTPGYPVLPVVFMAAALSLVIATLHNSPRESLMGLAIIATGAPFYFYFKRRGL